MENQDLELVTRPRPRESGIFDLSIPDGWQQGRGAFGGLTIASLVRATEAFAATPDRSLRSLTAELPGPTMVGPAEIRVEMLRAGSGQSTLFARLVQDGEVRAASTSVLAKARAPSADAWNQLVAPVLRPWREMRPLSMEGGFPAFARHLEYRTDGPFPFTGGTEARCEGWIRARTAGSMSRASYLAAMSDAWWPSAFSVWTSPRAIGTVAFTMQLFGADETIDDAIPLAHRAKMWVLHEGWMIEQRELWSEDGRLVALNQQTIAVIK